MAETVRHPIDPEQKPAEQIPDDVINERMARPGAPFRPGTWTEVGSGLHAAAHRTEIENQKNVIKVGHTEDLPVPVLGNKKIKLPRQWVSDKLKRYARIEPDIMPSHELTKKGLEEYRAIKKYFGADKTLMKTEAENPTPPNERTRLVEAMRDPRSAFYTHLSYLLTPYQIARAAAVIEKYKDEAFMPEEAGVVEGHPPDTDLSAIAQAKGEPGPHSELTYYIVQEEVSGIPLSRITKQELLQHPEVIERLLVFTILDKKMYHDTKRTIDTRPEHHLNNPLEYFRKTANILVDLEAGKINFVDTRSLRRPSDWYRRAMQKKVNHSVDKAITVYAALLDRAYRNPAIKKSPGESRAG